MKNPATKDDKKELLKSILYDKINPALAIARLSGKKEPELCVFKDGKSYLLDDFITPTGLNFNLSGGISKDKEPGQYVKMGDVYIKF